MRKKTSSSLQKTFDECYLIYSTANYFDTQGNEAEALRSWRCALDQIYYHNAHRTPTTYTPKSKTENTLAAKLRDLENQCKDRIKILEDMKKSRQEKPMSDLDAQSSKMPLNEPETSTKIESHEDSFRVNEIALTFKQLDIIDHDSSPGTITQLKSSLSKNVSEISRFSSKASSAMSYFYDSPSPKIRTKSQAISSLMPSKTKSQSVNPERRGKMRHTLRSCNVKVQNSPSRSEKVQENPFTSRAASLAWDSMGSSKNNICSNDKKYGNVNTKSYLNSCLEFSQSESSLLKAEKQQSLWNNLNSEIHPRSDLLISQRMSLENLDRLNSRVQLDDIPSKARNMYNSRSPIQNLPKGLDRSVKLHEPSSSSHGRYSVLASQRISSKKPGISSHACYSKNSSDTNATKTRIRSQTPSVAEPIHSADSILEFPTSKTERNNEITKNTPSSQKTVGFQQDKHVDVAAQNSQKRPGQVLESSLPSHKDAMIINEGTEFTRRDSRLKKTRTSLGHTDTKLQAKSNHENRENIEDIRISQLLEKLPTGVDEGAAKQIFNEIVVNGDEVHWNDIAGLDVAKTALKETVVYPFLRPDLFMGLREPAGGVLLFGPPGTGKTMLARAVATESKSTFFSISAGSLTSKYLGESEKLVRALFKLAKALAPSIIFVDEIDSLLSSRSGSGEHDSTRRIKTEFLIQWSDLQKAAAGQSRSEEKKEREDAGRVLVLAATNMPWNIDEAARRRFVRRQYIPLPDMMTRVIQLKNLLSRQKFELRDDDFQKLVDLTEGYSGSDITALAKDAAMGPLRSLGEAILSTSMDDIRPIKISDFEASFKSIRPSVSEEGLKVFEDWANVFGERGG